MTIFRSRVHTKKKTEYGKTLQQKSFFWKPLAQTIEQGAQACRRTDWYRSIFSNECCFVFRGVVVCESNV